VPEPSRLAQVSSYAWFRPGHHIAARVRCVLTARRTSDNRISRGPSDEDVIYSGRARRRKRTEAGWLDFYDHELQGSEAATDAPYLARPKGEFVFRRRRLGFGLGKARLRKGSQTARLAAQGILT
jgi:hypothetical protein